jgi:DNA-binding TFAR19-related protein (PDSD5 family)
MNIEDIKKKKMQEMNDARLGSINKQIDDQQALLSQMQKQIEMLESISKQYLSKEAISRYGAVKMAHPETAFKAIAFIAQAIQLGHIKEKIDDNSFKIILQEVKAGKTNFKIKK